MKKFAVAIIVLSIALLFTGCTFTIGSGSKNSPAKNNTETVETVEKPEPSIEESEMNKAETETPPDIPDAKEFPEFEWPTFGASTKVPTPEWSNYGEILVDSEITFWGQVGYTTLEDYNAYVKACQNAGYIEDYYNVAGYIYYGANADGYGVQLTYNQYEHYMAIQVTAYASEWDKWWVEDSE